MVSGDSPLKEHIFHFWALTDVVDDQVPPGLRGFSIDYHANVGNITAKIPRDNITPGVVWAVCARRKLFPLELKKTIKLGTRRWSMFVSVRKSVQRRWFG